MRRPRRRYAARTGLMVALTAVMVAERHERWGSRVSTVTGCTLVVAALFTLVIAGAG